MKFSSIIFFFLIFVSANSGQTKVFVKFKEHVNPGNINRQISSLIENSSLQKSTSVKKQITAAKSFYNEFGHLSTPLDRITTLTIAKGIDVEKFINDLKLNANVEFVQKSNTLKIDAFTTDDSLYNQQWGLQSVHAPEAWDLIPSDATKVLLAVIDTGIDYKHPDLKNILFINKGEVGIDINGRDKSSNGIDDDGNGFIDDFRGWDFVNKLDVFNSKLNNDFTDWDNDPMDENKHGTIVCGIIGAEHNTIGIAGVNPNVKILNLRAFDKNGEGEEDDVASAIIYAVKMGAKVINMSFGDKIYSQVLKDVLEYAHSQNVTLIASAGNSASNLPHYPSGFSQVISVGAIQEDEVFAGFSNYGSTIDLVAPGSQIISTTLENKYQKVSGTSVSAPFVSAAAAMLGSIKNFTNNEIKQILKSTAKDLGKPGWDERYGAGNLNILKSLQLPVPSEIQINAPEQDYFVKNNLLKINISVLSPYFKNFSLTYGIGFNPTEWDTIKTGQENNQVLNEDIYQLNTSSFHDTTYTLRLLVNNINGTTSEERVNFHIDKTKPEIKFASIIPSMLNDKKTFAASIATDDITTAQLFFRPYNQVGNFDSLYLDGLARDLKFNRNNHFSFVPVNKLEENTEYEFYFKVTNRAGLSTLHKSENQNNFILKNENNKNLLVPNIKNYTLPIGRIDRAPVKFDSTNTKYILVNENETSADLSIYKMGNTELSKILTLKKRIPVSVGDFNKDGKIDILSLFVKKGFIETQTAPNSLNFTNVFQDTSGNFWPSYAGDIDNDNKTEILTFSSDTSITIWEVQNGNNFNLIKEKTLYNFAKQSSPKIKSSFFRNNQILVDDFNNDSKNEIVTVDNYGRIITFNVLGANSYNNGIIKEHYYPVESKNQIVKGDFNGDGINELAILMEFENDLFISPLKYCSILSLQNLTSGPLFAAYFYDVSSSFVSAYEKKYNAIAFGNINNDDKDELIISSFPNTYIYDYIDSNQTKLRYYSENSNLQSIFIGDLDDNGFSDLGISNTSNGKLEFYDFNNDLISKPVIEDFYSIDSTHNFIKWKNDDNKPVKIFYGDAPDNLILTDTISGNTYLANVQPQTTTYYSIAFYNKQTGELLSGKSKIFSIYSHAPAKIVLVKAITQKSLEVQFTGRISAKEIYLNKFRIDSSITPNSLEAGSQYSIILHLKYNLSVGQHKLQIVNLRDFYNSPVSNNNVASFMVDSAITSTKKLYIKSYEIVNNYTLNISFNINLDTLTALNINNYTILPKNILSTVVFYKSSQNTLQIKTNKPFGSIGKEYTLEIKHLISSKSTGNLPLKENVGNQIVLVTSAKNLNDVYVYPNPINFDMAEHVTFANLTSNVEIYIYDLNGKFIKRLIEEDSNGGVTWNLKDENNNKINSGIYIYRVIAFDISVEVSQEKIGKFAVTR